MQVNKMANHTVDIQEVEKEWKSRGFQGGLWVDSPGQIWKDFVHDVDELVMLIEGEVKIDMKRSSFSLKKGEEVLIPAFTEHTVRNIGLGESRWLYAYKTACKKR